MGRMKEYAMDHPDIAACPCEQCDPSQSDYGCRECKFAAKILEHERLHEIAAKPKDQWTVKDCYDFLRLQRTRHD
jgi:hypothetical protein